MGTVTLVMENGERIPVERWLYRAMVWGQAWTRRDDLVMSIMRRTRGVVVNRWTGEVRAVNPFIAVWE